MAGDNLDFEVSSEAMEFFENLSDGESAADVLGTIAEAPETPETPEEALSSAEQPEEEGEVAEPDENEDEADEDSRSEAEGNEDNAEESDGEAAETVEEKYERRIRELQSHKDQQIAQLQQQIQAQQQWQQQVYEQMQQQQVLAEQAQRQATGHVTADDLARGLQTSPKETFQWVAHNRPDLIPQLTHLARQTETLGDAAADSMIVEYQNFQIRQMQEQQAAQQQAEYEAYQQQQAPLIVEQTINGIVESLAEQYPDFTELSDEVNQLAAERSDQFRTYCYHNGIEITPDVMRDFLRGTYLDVRDARMSQEARKPRKPRKVQSTEHVERGGPGNGPEELTPDEAAMNEILEGAVKLHMDISPLQ